MPARRSLQTTRAIGVDVVRRAGQAEAHADWRAGLERGGGADRDAAVAEIQGQRGGDGVAKAILDRDAEDHPRAASPIEVVGKQVRRQRRQNVLRGAVLVHVTGHAQRAEIADLFGACDRTAEDQQRQPAGVQFPDRADQLDPGRVRQPEIEHDQIDAAGDRRARASADPPRCDRDRVVSRGLEGGLKAVPDVRRIVSDHHGLGTDRRTGHVRRYRSASAATMYTSFARARGAELRMCG